MSEYRLIKLGLWLVVYVLSGLQFAIRQDAGVVAGTQPGRPDLWPVSSSEVTADFDGDQIPDLAIGRTEGSGYTVRVQFTTKLPATSLTLFEGGPGIRIFSKDVDNDSFPDIVVTSAASQFPIAIWISEGNGGFHAANPWSYFPTQIGSPYNLAPLKSEDRIAGFSGDERPFGGEPAMGPPASYEFQARDRVAASPAQVLHCSLFNEIPARGPPPIAKLPFV